MAFVGKGKKTKKKAGIDIDKIIEKTRKYLKSDKNTSHRYIDLEDVTIEKRDYTRKKDGKKIKLVIAKAPTKFGQDGDVFEGVYCLNRGYFAPYNG